MISSCFDTEAPIGGALTDYDRTHLVTYLRLLDAASESADWTEAVSIIFGIDAQSEPDRAGRMYETHLERARWMSREGYRLLLAESCAGG